MIILIILHDIFSVFLILPWKSSSYGLSKVRWFFFNQINIYDFRFKTLASHPGLHSASVPGILALDINANNTSRILTGGADKTATIFNKDDEQVCFSDKNLIWIEKINQLFALVIWQTFSWPFFEKIFQFWTQEMISIGIHREPQMPWCF